MTNGLFGAALGISICLTTLNSLTKIGILSSLGGAVLTHPLWVQEVPVSIPGSGRFLCLIFNQVFNENLVIVMLKSAAGERAARAVGRASTFGFRSITLVCFDLLTLNLLYG